MLPVLADLSRRHEIGRSLTFNFSDLPPERHDVARRQLRLDALINRLYLLQNVISERLMKLQQFPRWYHTILFVDMDLKLGGTLIIIFSGIVDRAENIAKHERVSNKFLQRRELVRTAHCIEVLTQNLNVEIIQNLEAA